MKLIVISSPNPVADEPQRINQLFDAGLECFHLRKPHYREEQLRELILQINPLYYKKVALHQHHVLAKEFGINMLHYAEKNRSLATAEKWEEQKAVGYHLSTSAHTAETLQQLSSCFAYTFFGPVFNSISKPGYPAAVPLDFCLAETDKAVPVVALGGIDAENISLIRKMNFDGAALLGSIWNQPVKAVDHFNEIRKKCQTPAHTH